MTVVFYGRVIEHTGGEKSYVPKVQDSALTVRELLDELGSHYGESFETFIHGDETCLILVNGSGITQTGGLDSPIVSGDKVEILPFVDAG